MLYLEHKSGSISYSFKYIHLEQESPFASVLCSTPNHQWMEDSGVLLGLTSCSPCGSFRGTPPVIIKKYITIGPFLHHTTFFLYTISQSLLYTLAEVELSFAAIVTIYWDPIDTEQQGQ